MFGYLLNITSTNGSQTWSQGIGSTHPFPSLTVESVLYVPDCHFNLLSVHRLTHSYDFLITMGKHSEMSVLHSIMWVFFLLQSCYKKRIFPFSSYKSEVMQIGLGHFSTTWLQIFARIN